MDEIIAEKVESFFRQYKHQQYKKGEILIRADNNPSGVFYLKEGFVKEYAISKKGDELVVNVFKPVAFFPMSWAITNRLNEYFYEAITDLNVWRAPRKEVITFIKSNPDVLFDLMSRVYIGTDGLLTRIVYLMSRNAHSRLIAGIIIHAKRFGKNGKNNSYKVVTSEKDIANQLGMTRETVSREMKVLKDKGFVTFSKNMLLIKNMDSLEDELSEGS